MPEELINDSIIVGTIVQAQLTRICIKYFLERQTKNFIVNITAQCMTPTYLFGNYENGIISVPIWGLLACLSICTVVAFRDKRLRKSKIVRDLYKLLEYAPGTGLSGGTITSTGTVSLANTAVSAGILINIGSSAH